MKKLTKSAGKAILKMGYAGMRRDMKRLFKKNGWPPPLEHFLKRREGKAGLTPSTVLQERLTKGMSVMIPEAGNDPTVGTYYTAQGTKPLWQMRAVRNAPGHIMQALACGWEPFQVSKKIIWFKRLIEAAKS